MVEVVRAGRKPGELAKEFSVAEQTIRNWLKQADLDAGKRSDGLHTEEREEMQRLRRENRSCAESGRSWQKPRPGSLGRPTQCSRHLPVRERVSGRVPDLHDLPCAGSLQQRILCVAQASSVGTRAAGRGVE
jgi:transposase-like protein